MNLRIILFTAISGIFIPLNSAIASPDRYEYGFHWGGLNAICAAYKINTISTSDATMLLNSIVEMSNEGIKDTSLRNRFKNLVETDEGLKEAGCSRLIKPVSY